MLERIGNHPINRVAECCHGMSATSSERPVLSQFLPAERGLMKLSYIEDLIDDHGQITLGYMSPVGCVAIANDESNSLAMLKQRPGESLQQLLEDWIGNRKLQSKTVSISTRSIHTELPGHCKTVVTGCLPFCSRLFLCRSFSWLELFLAVAFLFAGAFLAFQPFLELLGLFGKRQNQLCGFL